MTEQKQGQQILIVDFTEGGVGGERLVGALRHEFPTVTVDHIAEFARVHAALRCTTYDLVVIVTDHRVHDAQLIAEGIRTARFVRFYGAKIFGARQMTPIIILVPERHISAFASTPHVQCVSMNADVRVLLDAVANHGLARRTASDSLEVQNVVSESPGERHHRPKITRSA